MKFQIMGKIIFNNQLSDGFYHLKVHAPQIASIAEPGQFIHIRCQNSLTPLLRRPMSIFNIDKKNLEIIYRLKGPGTQALTERKPGELLDILGPLGNGFNISNHSHFWLVGGGIGAVPLFYLAKKLKQKKLSHEIFLGARHKEELITLNFLNNKLAKISTDDGSFGYKGRITDLVEAHIKSIDTNKLKIFSCGPKPMLRVLQEIVNKNKISCEISLEEYMGCGVGGCLSCVCKSTDNQYKRVCQEGPVFNANEVILE